MIRVDENGVPDVASVSRGSISSAEAERIVAMIREGLAARNDRGGLDPRMIIVPRDLLKNVSPN